MENDKPVFPQEIITSILVRLPVKSLIRFQCVCKDWKNLFRTPSFFAEHLHHSTRQNPLLIVDSNVSEGNPWHLDLLNREMQIYEFQNTHIIVPLTPGLEYSNNGLPCVHLRWVCSSNGLLCVDFGGNSQDSFLLCNPAIRVVRQVPKSLYNYEYERLSVGFGFSPIINDYKIVKLFFSGCSVVQGEVYSLKTGVWRKVEVGNIEGVNSVRGRAFPCNGSIFWIGHKEGVEGHSQSCLGLIVSFDIAKEVLTLTPFPTMTSRQGCYNELACYENKLAIISSTGIEDSESCVIDLWVLEECTDPSRERWSWAKIYTSRPGPCRLIIYPEIIWRNEIVCSAEALPEYQIEGKEDDEGNVVLCNLTTDEFKFLDIPIGKYSFWILDYVQSLVLLDNIHV